MGTVTRKCQGREKKELNLVAIVALLRGRIYMFYLSAEKEMINIIRRHNDSCIEETGAYFYAQDPPDFIYYLNCMS